MFVVELRSDEYGNEAFKYPTLEEALQGARRLVRACRKVYPHDGVAREVVLVVGKIGEEDDWGSPIHDTPRRLLTPRLMEAWSELTLCRAEA